MCITMALAAPPAPKVSFPHDAMRVVGERLGVVRSVAEQIAGERGGVEAGVARVVDPGVPAEEGHAARDDERHGRVERPPVRLVGAEREADDRALGRWPCGEFVEGELEVVVGGVPRCPVAAGRRVGHDVDRLGLGGSAQCSKRGGEDDC
jgi:hypothetical protein